MGEDLSYNLYSRLLRGTMTRHDGGLWQAFTYNVGSGSGCRNLGKHPLTSDQVTSDWHGPYTQRQLENFGVFKPSSR